jgi:hypothetical protein
MPHALSRAAVFDDGSRKLTVQDMFAMSAVTRCMVQSFLKLPASNDEDTLLLLPALFVGSAAQLRSFVQVEPPPPPPPSQQRPPPAST